MLKFDDQTSRFLDEVYRGSDFRERRRASFNALAPAAGQTLLDLGCGNGMLTTDLARAVGPEGRVIGLDPSADMLNAAKTRCDGQPNVTLVNGSADALPFDDASLDSVVSVQVFEYLPDLPRAMAELARVLRPGGRAVIADLHLGTMIWHSENPARMARMIGEWSHHCTEPELPQHLPGLVRDCGLELRALDPLVFTDTTLREDGLARMMLTLMARYAAERGEVPSSEIEAWKAEQIDLAARGRFFFSFTQFVCVAHAPG